MVKRQLNLFLNLLIVALWRQWLQELTPTVTTTNVQDDEVDIVTEYNEVTLTEDENVNLFQDTSSEEEMSNELLQANLQALQEPTDIIKIQIHDLADANFPLKGDNW